MIPVEPLGECYKRANSLVSGRKNNDKSSGFLQTENCNHENHALTCHDRT